jgi:hypothetical protein
MIINKKIKIIFSNLKKHVKIKKIEIFNFNFS